MPLIGMALASSSTIHPIRAFCTRLPTPHIETAPDRNSPENTHGTYQHRGMPRSPVSLLAAHAQSTPPQSVPQPESTSQSPPTTPMMTTVTPSTTPSSTTPRSSSSPQSPSRSTFWQTVLSPAGPAAPETSAQRSGQHQARPPLPTDSGPAANSGSGSHGAMVIPCVVCGVRFRKPGHLNMHWRSVHARHHPPPTMTGTTRDMYKGQEVSSSSMGFVMAMANAAMPPAPSQPQTHHAGTSLTQTKQFNDENHRYRGQHGRLKSSLSSGCALSTSIRAGETAVSKLSRAYACPQCDASFRRGSDRNRHMRMVHAKIRPFECTLCGNHFGRKSFLEAHVLTVHHKVRPFRCQCGAAFGQRSSLTRHARKIHGREPA